MPAKRAEIFDWFVLAVAVLAVFGTLSYARTVFDLISSAGFADTFKVAISIILFSFGAAMLGWMLMVAKIRRLSDYLLLAGLAAVYLVVLLTLSDMPVERVHLIEYGLIGLLAHQALRHRFAGGDRALLAVLVTLDVGLIDEVIQGLLPRRFYDTKDILVNTIAGLLGVLAAMLGVAYSLRFVHETFFGRGPLALEDAPHESPRWMKLPCCSTSVSSGRWMPS